MGFFPWLDLLGNTGGYVNDSREVTSWAIKKRAPGCLLCINRGWNFLPSYIWGFFFHHDIRILGLHCPVILGLFFTKDPDLKQPAFQWKGFGRSIRWRETKSGGPSATAGAEWGMWLYPLNGYMEYMDMNIWMVCCDDTRQFWKFVNLFNVFCNVGVQFRGFMNGIPPLYHMLLANVASNFG